MTSVTAAQTSDPAISIITIVTEGDTHVLDQIVKQTLKMEEVKSITLLPPNESLLSETIMLTHRLRRRHNFAHQGYR